MSSTGSVTRLVKQIKIGSETAAADLLNRYCSRLVALARKKLRGASRRIEDEDDVAMKAFAGLCLGARAGKFPLLENRNDLWALLIILTTRKAADQIARWKRKKRGGGKVHGHSGVFSKASADGPGSFDDLLHAGPGPETLNIWQEEYNRLMKCLGNDTLRQVAEWSVEGYQIQEIAAKLGCSRSTINRKLALIKKILIAENPA